MKQNNKQWIYLNLLSLLILITFLTLLFCRAAQKLNIKSHKKKKHHEEKEERPQFPTNFSDVIRMNPAARPARPGTQFRAAPEPQYRKGEYTF